MIDALFNQTNYVATKRLLDATALRQEAIAANLANLETPNYKRLDVAPAFQDQLKAALQSGDGTRINSVQPSLAVDTAAIANGRDGNTVQLESELLAMSQNTMAHTLETQLITGSMLRLRTAISGKTV